jgi:hypothetical protein
MSNHVVIAFHLRSYMLVHAMGFCITIPMLKCGLLFSSQVFFLLASPPFFSVLFVLYLDLLLSTSALTRTLALSLARTRTLVHTRSSVCFSSFSSSSTYSQLSRAASLLQAQPLSILLAPDASRSHLRSCFHIHTYMRAHTCLRSHSYSRCRFH